MMRMLEHGEPEVSDRELARGPQQESFTELRFEGCDPSRDGGLGQAHALRGARKTAFVDDASEKEQVVGLEIHFVASFGGNTRVKVAGIRRSRRFHCCSNGTIISILRASESSRQQIH